ncbi:Extended synaptotagmin [Phytophthora palmivora]|uniref:Extended synaptotagmin n=1 Tax=Phytophthora palmivora TaxID=4796 RepID=A0A2P4XI29_9STRA|nr:Extended synaptotagmin [Phytophthora palmivora]
MVVHRKNKQRQRFLMSKTTHFVVANAMKHALEIYNNESRSELVYLLSLANAVLSFESDNANIVMEKCFCVEVRTWKKKNTVRLQPQGFIFFEENQARMLLWVKCIHLGIKRATTLDSELFRSPSTASSIEHSRRFSDNDETQAKMGVPTCEDSHCSSSIASSGSSPTTASGFTTARDKLTHRLVIDPATRFVTAGRTMLTPTRSSSVTGERHPNRWSSMFSYDKQQQTRSPMSSTATEPQSSPSETSAASPKVSSWGKRSSKAAPDVSPETTFKQSIDHTSSSRSGPFRVKIPAAPPSKNESVIPTAKSSTVTEKLDDVEPLQHVTLSPGTSGSLPAKLNHENVSADLVDDPEPATFRVLTIMLVVAVVAGALDVSVFLPLALAGALAHFFNQHQCFSSWTISSLVVFLASSYQVLFGIGTSTVLLYIWGYASYKTERRRRLKRQAVVHFPGTQSSYEIAHFEVSAREPKMLYLLVSVMRRVLLHRFQIGCYILTPIGSSG